MSFTEWMTREQYAPSTMRQTLSVLDQLRRAQPLHTASQAWLQKPEVFDAAKRYGRYLETTTARSSFDNELLEALKAPRSRRRLQRRRKHEAVSFRDEDWAKLFTKLKEQREPEAVVILVIFATGLRIGDVLRLRRDALRKAIDGGATDVVTIQKGNRERRVPVAGAREYWLLLYERWSDGATLAQWLCPTSKWGAETPGGAYQRVRRHLQATCAELGLDGRAYLHRLRRTVAVRALESTKDVHLVQQLLGHANIGATQLYTDELRSREVAALQQRLLRGGSR